MQAEEAAEEGGQAEVRRQTLDRQGVGDDDGARLAYLQGRLQHRHQGNRRVVIYEAPTIQSFSAKSADFCLF